MKILVCAPLLLFGAIAHAQDLYRCTTTRECAVEDGAIICYQDVIGRVSHLFAPHGTADRVLFEDGLVKVFKHNTGADLFISRDDNPESPLTEVLHFPQDTEGLRIAFFDAPTAYHGISEANCESVD
ncbi:MAG: hypothetical protein AAF307_12145 [Pseudomonadota bacterium]